MTQALRPRMVRLPAEGVAVHFRNGTGTVVNISAGGAFLRVNAQPESGTSHRIVLAKGDHHFTVDALVLRVTPDFSSPDAQPLWLVAVQFKAEPAEMRRTVSTLLEPTPPSSAARRSGATSPVIRRS